MSMTVGDDSGLWAIEVAARDAARTATQKAVSARAAWQESPEEYRCECEHWSRWLGQEVTGLSVDEHGVLHIQVAAKPIEVVMCRVGVSEPASGGEK